MSEEITPPVPVISKELAALDESLREQGLSLALLLIHVAKQSFGVEVTIPKAD